MVAGCDSAARRRGHRTRRTGRLVRRHRTRVRERSSDLRGCMRTATKIPTET